MAMLAMVVDLDDLYLEDASAHQQGAFGDVLVRIDRKTGCKEAIKLISRSEVTEQTERELLHYRMLRHPCISQLKRVFLTDTHLAIAMEYVPGGSLMRFVDRKLLTEAQARFLFQQLVCAVEFCHSQGAISRSLSLDTVLVAGSAFPELKLTDLGFCKLAGARPDGNAPSVSVYSAPEVLIRSQSATAFRPFNLRAAAEAADVWSLGVILGALLFHTYPFADPKEPKNVDRTFQRIMAAEYSVPENVCLSEECKDLLSKIFRRRPEERITLADIRKHEWFITRLPRQLAEPYQSLPLDKDAQPLEELTACLAYAKESQSGLCG